MCTKASENCLSTSKRLFRTWSRVKLEIGIPTITRNQLMPQKINGKAPTLIDYKKKLRWKSFPYYLEFNNLHQDIISDYTCLTEADELENHVPIRVTSAEQGAAAYYTTLNPPWQQTNISAVNYILPIARKQMQNNANNRPHFSGQKQRQQQQHQTGKENSSGTICAFCHKPNHIDSTCWRKHPQLKPAWDKERQQQRQARSSQPQ